MTWGSLFDFDLAEARTVALHDQLAAAICDAKAAGDEDAVMDLYEEAHDRARSFLACPPECGHDGCRWGETAIHGQIVRRVPFGYETPECGGKSTDAACSCCGARRGHWHHRGCMREECPVCHDLLEMRCRHRYLEGTRYWEVTGIA